MTQLALLATPGRAIWRWLRTVPLFQSHVGHHVETFIENFLDDQYVRKLRRMRDRPVYTPPQTVTIAYEDLDCFQPDPRFALEVHHNLPGPAGARRQAASEPAMAVMPTAETDESLYPLEMTWVAVGQVGELDRGAASPVREAGPESSREKGLPGPNAPGRNLHDRAGEHHHRDWTVRPLAAVRDGLAPWIAAALANAKADDTVIDRDHTTVSRWLENVVGGDPFDGKGSSDGYVEWLFAGMAGAR